jgi:hypothetical protein
MYTLQGTKENVIYTCRFCLATLLFISLFLTSGVKPAQAAGEDVQFVGARFIVGKGLLVMLKVSEVSELTQETSVNTGGFQYDLNCQVAETNSSGLILRCLASIPASSIGDEAVIKYGSSSFTTTLKEPRPWCYSVFDFGPDGWGLIGSHCQQHTAAVGDMIQFYNPDYPAVPFWDYRYDLNSARACNGHSPDFGDGYYFFC